MVENTYHKGPEIYKGEIYNVMDLLAKEENKSLKLPKHSFLQDKLQKKEMLLLRFLVFSKSEDV